MKQKLRHRVFYRLLYLLAGPFIKLAMHYRCQKAPAIEGPLLIVANHTTNLDPALVGLSFPRQIYFVASEHTTRWGLASRLLRFVFAPIIRLKGKTDAKVGMQIIRTLRAGHRVCLFGEGNRSYSGLTGPVFPATGKLAKAGGATLVTYRLQGGYFAAPRWGKKMRKGPMRGAVVKVYPPAELEKMTADEVNAAIQRDIGEDAYAHQQADPQPYTGRDLAEYIETALYLCPACGGVSTLRSAGDGFACACGLQGRYDVYGALAGEGLPYATVRDWDIWQQGETARLIAEAGDAAICADEDVTLYEVAPGVGGTPAGEGALALYADKFTCAGRAWPLAEVNDLAIVARQTLVFGTTDGKSWEIRSPRPMSALKYQRLYHRLVERGGAR